MKSLAELGDLAGRVAVVTGACGKLGSVLAEGLAELGASIVVLDLSDSACRKEAARLSRSYGQRSLPYPVDLRDSASVRRVPDVIHETFGRLDIIVHCAALVGTSDRTGWTTKFSEQSLEAWRDALDINLSSAFVLIQACADLLAASGYGSIVNVGSIYGVVGPDWRLYEGTAIGSPAGYSASKGALLQFTRWLATTLAPLVRVNSISPGGIFRETEEPFLSRYVNRTPLQRMATEEDMKGAVAYLASDLSAYVTGQNLIVDGGWTAW